MVNRQKKMLGWIDTIKKGSRALLGKELSGALNKKQLDLLVQFLHLKKVAS